MRILKNSITIIAEIVILIISVIWYSVTKDYEPLIAIIAGGIALIGSLSSKFLVRPKIKLHQYKTDWGRSPKGYTRNNPPIIRVGIDIPEQYWELSWHYILEIRNNSSQAAYDVVLDYKNLPEKTFIKGESGKIEPILANDNKEFKIKVIQNITGTHIEADEYLKNRINDLMKNTKIIVKYKDESGHRYRTKYLWEKDENKLLIL